ncbi:uncharacterized protein LOC118738182 [Rhagoletis pomonella]|uniref:uncharacterized protein LOC118738182 n=1 Tax=Rhagoletis pomonella TaxID=28610 RepID=UPI00178762DE|nr:uncharacterized protein LOC118738182 [Rhagoletis pomonella]
MWLIYCCLAQLLTGMTIAGVAESDGRPVLQRKEFVTLHKWTELKLTVPESYQQPSTLDAIRFAQDKLLPVDVDVEYGDDGYHRTFLTIPRLSNGVLYSLTVVADSDNSTVLNPLLVPYPSYDWHLSFGQNCSTITSAIRTFIDDCWRLWVVDLGQINGIQYCAPQILAFDLVTDQLIHRYIIPASQYTPGVSIFTALAVDVDESAPNLECVNAMVYIADPWGYGLIVYNMAQGQSWRIQNTHMQPDQLLTQDKTGSSGIFTVSISPRQHNKEEALMLGGRCGVSVSSARYHSAGPGIFITRSFPTNYVMWTGGFILLLLALTLQVIVCVKQRNSETVYQWKQLVYGFPTEQDRQEALANGNLVPANGIPIDVAPHQQSQKGSRVFITIPRFQTGIPYTLATVSDSNEANGPVLIPYPNYTWHNANGEDCNKITSAFRVAITECNQMFVIDSGVIGTTQNCPPQLLIFDLNTDTLAHRYRFEGNMYVPVASLLITPLVVVHDPPPKGRCQRLHVYIADVTHHGLVIYDSESNSAWRAENKFMYPDPDYGTHTIARESFILMDGMFALATDHRQLYFHPLASNSEYAVPLSVLNNRTNWDGNMEAMQNEFRMVGKRSSECAAEAMDSQRNLYCVTFNPINAEFTQQRSAEKVSWVEMRGVEENTLLDSSICICAVK